jgi:hypothetical protein
MKPKLIPADYLRNNPFAEKHMYKIYHDGDHPVATRIVRSKGKRPPKKPANRLIFLDSIRTENAESFYFKGL